MKAQSSAEYNKAGKMMFPAKWAACIQAAANILSDYETSRSDDRRLLIYKMVYTILLAFTKAVEESE